MELYCLSLSKIYKRFFVEANSFSEAEEKLKEYLKLNESNKYKIEEDGSIKYLPEAEKEKEVYVEEIQRMSKFIIK